MTSELSDIERMTLCRFLAEPGPVRDALRKFAFQRTRSCESQSAEALRTIPRHFEEACDASAKAEVYAGLMKDIERFANKV